jgi:hypothetical protein
MANTENTAEYLGRADNHINDMLTFVLTGRAPKFRMILTRPFPVCRQPRVHQPTICNPEK